MNETAHAGELQEQIMRILDKPLFNEMGDILSRLIDKGVYGEFKKYSFPKEVVHVIISGSIPNSSSN